MNKIAIVQSNYFPWIGYFDLINYVDKFIVFDDVQFTKRHWRNRNKIKSKNGVFWLTVPVKTKGKFKQNISEVLIDGFDWKKKHQKSLENTYGSSKHFEEIYNLYKPIFDDNNLKYLSDLNYLIIKLTTRYLGLKTKIYKSNEFKIIEGKNQRLIHLCEQAGSSIYVSGEVAKIYLDENEFNKNGLSIEYFKYKNYSFVQNINNIENLSILDTLFRYGKNIKKLIFN